ncbi:MAG: RecX family transcriptional regulator [Candidatus Omnitrophota bacterium]|jgi:regulatory protein
MEDFRKALNYSFLLLKYRPRSRQEIIDRLKRKKYSSGVVEKAILFLEENNYINDEEFARLFVASSLNRGWGRKRIDYTLKKLGVAEDVRRIALLDKQAFYERLRELVERKILNKARDKKTYQKIIRNLATKGFNYEDIIRALEEAGFKKPGFSTE